MKFHEVCSKSGSMQFHEKRLFPIEGLHSEELKAFYEAYCFHTYSHPWQLKSGWGSKELGWYSLAGGALDQLPEDVSSHPGSATYAMRE